MYTLLLDSSNRNLSVGLARGGEVFEAVELEAWQQQSELMIPAIHDLLNKHQLTSQDLSDIIVAIGPGSYTGVRIAVTIAKIMAFLLNVNLYTVSSLAVLSVDDLPTICLVNARSGRSYFAVYQGTKALVNDSVLTNDEVLDYIATHPDYQTSGDIEYLGINPAKFNRFTNMLKFKQTEFLVNDLLSVKPTYLKD